MTLKIVVPSTLILVGLLLAALSVPDIAENTALGVIGVVSGLLLSASAIGPLLAAFRSDRGQGDG